MSEEQGKRVEEIYLLYPCESFQIHILLLLIHILTN